MRTVRIALPLLLAFSGAAGCVSGISDPPGDDGPGDDGGPVQPPPVVKPPPPKPAVYKRGSLAPIYQLTPRQQYGKFTQQGVQMNDADFQVQGAVNFIPQDQKMADVEGQLRLESAGFKGLDPEDRDALIPFRGNPTDVKFLKIDGQTKIYVPLGGGTTTPGNEVSVVTLDENGQQVGLAKRIRVGIRPKRVAVSPTGLVFVCNQYSNYISVIDANIDELLIGEDGQPVEIKTEFYCSDMLLVDRNINARDPEKQILYVANAWRTSVLEYNIDIDVDDISNEVRGVTQIDPGASDLPNKPAAEIAGVGATPFRLALSQDQRSLWVNNSNGGEVSKIDRASRKVKRIFLSAPVAEGVEINGAFIAATTTPNRGLPRRGDDLPDDVNAGPIEEVGVDGERHVAHPGAQFDETKSYNFEDVRHGLFQLDLNLNNAEYFTDDNSPEEEFNVKAKIMAGTGEWAVIRTKNGRNVWVANSSSDQVQELSVVGGVFKLAKGNDIFTTQERPYAMALDEAEGKLMVANWGGETLQIFDVGADNNDDNQVPLTIDLGYAQADYPATNIERGEYFFYNAGHANNGRKSCFTCHFDDATTELADDGVPFANGATAPTAYHQVRPNYNQMETDSYFWNGSFENGSYASLAADAQARVNCELVLFALVEGAEKEVGRIGDPANQYTAGAAQDAQCNPDTDGAAILPDNFDAIAKIVADEKVIRNDKVLQLNAARGFNNVGFLDVARLTDFYSASELRLAPNPLKYLKAQSELDSETTQLIDRGEQVFGTAGCARCHFGVKLNDGTNHGRGATYAADFRDLYNQDERLRALLPQGVPQVMSQAIRPAKNDTEINVHHPKLDFFRPFVFNTEDALTFDDPITARGNATLEEDRLRTLILVNLANVDRGFLPGSITGKPLSNTPSLRGIWRQVNFLRHGLARSFAEVVLPPGHKALQDGELGYAVEAVEGKFNVHGNTADLPEADVKALNLYLQTIE